MVKFNIDFENLLATVGVNPGETHISVD